MPEEGKADTQSRRETGSGGQETPNAPSLTAGSEWSLLYPEGPRKNQTLLSHLRPISQPLWALNIFIVGQKYSPPHLIHEGQWDD